MLTSSPSPDVFVAATDKEFYVQLGARIADARKAAGLTQVQLAEALGIAQQTMAHYEGGVSRIAVAMLPTAAKVCVFRGCRSTVPRDAGPAFRGKAVQW